MKTVEEPTNVHEWQKYKLAALAEAWADLDLEAKLLGAVQVLEKLELPDLAEVMRKAFVDQMARNEMQEISVTMSRKGE